MPSQPLPPPPKISPGADGWMHRLWKQNAANVWTPSITFDTPGNLSVAYTTRKGDYEESHKWVTINFTIVTSTFTHTTASGQLRITGMPFTPINETGHIWFGPLNWQGITKAGFTDMAVAASPGIAFLNITASGSAQATANLVPADMPTGGTVVLRGQVRFRI